MKVFSNILDMVGQTPMLEVTHLDTGPCRLFLKLELMNPAGSIKDRIGITMIEEAEKRGDISPGDTIVEATAGNTGLDAPRSHLFTHPEAELNDETAREFSAALARRHQGEPVAYITGSKEFWSLPLKVNRDTLVPRPETETLVEQALLLIPRDRPCRRARVTTRFGSVCS